MKFLLLFLTITTMTFAAPPTKAEEITYEFLLKTAAETGYCDHIPHIQKIFDTYKVKTLLEFGLGYSTKYFLDHCTKVLSVEFITSGISPNWMKYCLDLYRGYSNWISVAYFSNFSHDCSWAPYKFLGTAKLYEAETEYSRTQVIPNDTSLAELRTFIGNLLKYNKPDLALVDPPLLLRAPFVQFLFDKVPIILATDCSQFITPQTSDVYGYRKIAPPDNYETIYIPKAKGTLLWIKKSDETKNLIEVMKEYAQTP